MGDFFNGLDRAGPAKSLRRAQLDYLATSGAPLHPYYWAAFATFGPY
jgi:CHAT domain-containing protein